MTAQEIAKTFEDCAIDHEPDGWPAVQQKELSEAAAMLRKQADRIEQLETALSECRDSITPPAPGAATESAWNEAMQMPLAVPAYVKETMARLERENAELAQQLKEMQRMCLGYQEEHAELRKDATRYRWLRDQNADLYAGFYVCDETNALPDEEFTWVGTDLDSEIDAAMQKEQP